MFIILDQHLVTRPAVKKFHNSANFYLGNFAGGCGFMKRGLRFCLGDNDG